MLQKKEIKKLKEIVRLLEVRFDVSQKGMEMLLSWIEKISDKINKTNEKVTSFIDWQEKELDKLMSMVNNLPEPILPAILEATKADKRDECDCDSCYEHKIKKVLKGHARHKCKRKVWEDIKKPEGSIDVSETKDGIKSIENEEDWPASGLKYYYINIYSKNDYGIVTDYFNTILNSDGEYMTSGEKVLFNNDMLFKSEEELRYQLIL